MQQLHMRELERYSSPGGRPQPIAVRDGILWVGSRDTNHLYAIDPKTWTVTERIEVPGEPYGIAPFGDELRVVIGIGEDDDRFLYRCIPGKGLDEASKTPCPDLTGSHLFSDGTSLYLVQMTNRRIVTLDASGAITREIPLPERCAGFAFGHDGLLHVITADEEFEDLHFATIDLSQGELEVTTIAALPSEARSLAFDGSAWWTNLRDIGEIMSFTIDR